MRESGYKMRINSVNTFNYRNNNFKGLWGKTSNVTDFDPVICVPVNNKTYYYFPFADEAEADLTNLKDDIDRARIINVDEKTTKCEIVECKICAVLPFTAAQFMEYNAFAQDSDFNNMIKRIHSMVRDKYTNRDEAYQHPAINNAVEEEAKHDRMRNNPYARY